MRKLPVFDAFNYMFATTFENIGFAFAISWPWLLVLMPFRIASQTFILANGVQTAGSKTVAFILIYGLAFITLVAFSSIAVNWHRYVLSDEVPEGMMKLRLDRPVWYYVFYVIGLIILIILIVAAIGFTAVVVGPKVGDIHSNPLAGILFVIVVLGAIPFAVWLGALFLRWSIKLVALALGDLTFTMRQSREVSQGNTWRLLWLYVLFSLIGLLVGAGGLGLSYIANFSGIAALSFVAIAISLLASWFTTIMGITMLTSLYVFFVEKKDYA